MALSAQSTCTQVSNMLASDPKVSSQSKASGSGVGVLPLPVKPKFQNSQLRRTKSKKPVRSSKPAANASAQGAPSVEKECSISEAVSKVGEEIATTSGEILEAMDSVIEDGPASMRVRKSGKSSSRTSRRRALVMCLALGMVRPCASNVANSLQQSNDIRRTASASITRTSSSSFKAPQPLASQVSLATTLKHTNLLGEQEDLQKLTTLQ